MAPDERMSDLEHLMWRLDRDPLLTPSIANLSVLDTAPDIAHLRERMLSAVDSVPRLGQRIVDVPGHIAPPIWRSDASFDIADHVQKIELPPDRNTMADVERLAGELASTPFAANRPPWVFTVITGIEGGRAAMVQQMHHAVADGEGSLRMSMAFMDFERNPNRDPGANRGERSRRATTEPMERADTSTQRSGTQRSGTQRSSTQPPGTQRPTNERPADRPQSDQAPPDPPQPTPLQQWVTDAADALKYRAQGGADLFSRILNGAAERLRNPSDITSLGSDVVGIVQSLGRQARSIEHTTSPLWSTRSPIRSFATFQVPFDPIKARSVECSVTVNDLFVAAVLGACRTFHASRGAQLERLNVSIPVSTRHGRPGGNLFAPTVSEIAVTPTSDQQLDVVASSMSLVKSDRSINLIEPLAGTVNLLPIPLILQAGRWVTGHVDVVCSNIRAAPFAAYIAGAKVEANYPIGPLSGSAVNVTMMTYAGQANIGVHTDQQAVADAHELVQHLEASFRELIPSAFDSDTSDEAAPADKPKKRPPKRAAKPAPARKATT